MGDMADSIEWFVADYGMLSDDICPCCGSWLNKKEDHNGVFFYCINAQCMSCYSYDELKNSR